MTAGFSWHEGTWLLHCLRQVALIIGLVASFLNILNTHNEKGEQKEGKEILMYGSLHNSGRNLLFIFHESFSTGLTF